MFHTSKRKHKLIMCIGIVLYGSAFYTSIQSTVLDVKQAYLYTYSYANMLRVVHLWCFITCCYLTLENLTIVAILASAYFIVVHTPSLIVLYGSVYSCTSVCICVDSVHCTKIWVAVLTQLHALANHIKKYHKD